MGKHLLPSYRRKFVDAYVEEMRVKMEEALKEKDNEISAKVEALREAEIKYVALERLYAERGDKIIELQSKQEAVTEALIDAKAKANDIIDGAKVEAEKEKMGTVAQLDGLREEVINRRKLVDELRTETERISQDLKAACNEVNDRINKAIEGIIELSGKDALAVSEHFAIPEQCSEEKAAEEKRACEEDKEEPACTCECQDAEYKCQCEEPKCDSEDNKCECEGSGCECQCEEAKCEEGAN